LQVDLSQTEAQRAIIVCHSFCQSLEQRLITQNYLLKSYSFTDVGFFMAQLFGENMGAILTEETPHLITWRNRMIKRNSVQTGVIPMVNFLNKVNRPIPEFLKFLIE